MDQPITTRGDEMKDEPKGNYAEVNGLNIFGAAERITR